MDNYLKKIRLTLGYNQQEMADKLIINVNTYRGYEYQKRDLPPDFVLQLANILNVNLHFLYTGHGPMFIEPITAAFEECDDADILKNFKDLHKRYTKMVAELNTTDYFVSKKTGISESRLEKIGLGDSDITMEEFIKLRSKYAFDANMFLYNKSVSTNCAEREEEFSAEELAVLKKLAKKIK